MIHYRFSHSTYCTAISAVSHRYLSNLMVEPWNNIKNIFLKNTNIYIYNGGGGCYCCCYSCSCYSHSQCPPHLFSASHLPLGLHIYVRSPFIPHLCSFMHAQACLCSFVHICACSCPLLSPLPFCCCHPHGPSHGICIKDIVSVPSVVILLTFRTSTIHLNIEN